MTNARASRRDERGSAYVITLLALVVLTILGLGLALITQTEMQVGATEVTQQRIFYAADSGVSRATARAVAKFNCAPISGADFEIFDQDVTVQQALMGLREQVDVSPTLPVIDSPCALCQINNAAGSGQYGEQIYYDIHHAVTAQATRVRAGTTDTMGQRQVSGMIALQPWPEIGDCFAYINQPVSGQVKM